MWPHHEREAFPLRDTFYPEVLARWHVSDDKADVGSAHCLGGQGLQLTFKLLCEGPWPGTAGRVPRWESCRADYTSAVSHEVSLTFRVASLPMPSSEGRQD